MNNIRLTKTQRRVLLDLSRGIEMTKLFTGVIFKTGCRSSTFDRLKILGLIQPYGKRKFGQEFRLSKNGKSVVTHIKQKS